MESVGRFHCNVVKRMDGIEAMLKEQNRDNEVVFVAALDKGTGFIKTGTSCDRKDADRYAKYYRSIGYNARILTYEELEKLEEQEKAERG